MGGRRRRRGRPHPHAARLDPARPVHQPAADRAAPLRAHAGRRSSCPRWWPGCAAASPWTSRPRRRRCASAATRSARSARRSTPCGRPPSGPRSTRRGSARASTTCSATWRGATSRCCSASSPCSTSMERRATDPDVLEDLFKMDHLTTRMRRHAEGLIILSGAPPGRSWSAPVKLIDVMRGAVSEVEDYARVTVSTQSRAALAGLRRHRRDPPAGRADRERDHPLPAVHAGPGRRRDRRQRVRDRDRGPRPRDDHRSGWHELNERLANPPDINPANTEQLGLFVVGQLARRHGISVMLRPSPYGGTTAVVLIPLTRSSSTRARRRSPRAVPRWRPDADAEQRLRDERGVPG